MGWSLTKTINTLRRELDALTSFQVVVSYIVLIIFLVIPLASILYKAFVGSEGFTLTFFESMFSDPRMVSPTPNLNFIVVEETPYYTYIGIGSKGPNFGIILNSIFVATVVTIIDLILGTIAAFIMARYDFPGKSIFRILLVVPLLATPFVNAYVIGKVLGRAGLLNLFIQNVLGLKNVIIEIAGLPAVILIQSLSFFPIVYLNALASFINIDPSMEEQAENLGAHGFKLFRTVTLPLAKPGIAAGATLVFIFSIEDLGAPIGLSGAFGHGLHQEVMSFYIYEQFKAALSLELVDPTVYAVAVVMLSIAIVGFLAIKKYISLRQYAMLSKGSRWNPRVRRPEPWKMTVIYVFLILLICVAAFPQFGVITLAFTDWAQSTLPTKFTLEYVQSLFEKGEVQVAIRNSLTYSILATLMIVLVGSSVAYVVSRRKVFGREMLDVLSTMPIAMPGILVGLGYIVFFGTFFAETPLDPFLYPGTLLIFTYTVRRMPFTVRSIFAGLQQTHVSLEEAAMILGASRARTFLTIALPLIAANVIGGALLSFVYCMNEVSTSLMLGSLDDTQAPITYLMSKLIYGSAAVGTVSITAALGVILMTLQITAITLSNYILKQRTAFLGV